MDDKKKKYDEETDDLYDNEKVEEAMEEDEIEPGEAGFMEGYNQKQKKNPKEPKEIVQDDE